MFDSAESHNLSEIVGREVVVPCRGEECRLCGLIVQFEAGVRTDSLVVMVLAEVQVLTMFHDVQAEFRERRDLALDFMPGLRDKDRRDRQLFLHANGTRGPVEIERGWTRLVKPPK